MRCFAVASGSIDITHEGTLVGTPAYMAPEQLRAEPVDARADQFAWGVVAYELLSGRRPWETTGGGYPLAAEILTRQPPRLRAVAPGVSARVESVPISSTNLSCFRYCLC